MSRLIEVESRPCPLEGICGSSTPSTFIILSNEEGIGGSSVPTTFLVLNKEEGIGGSSVPTTFLILNKEEGIASRTTCYLPYTEQ